MSTEENKTITRRLFEDLNKGIEVALATHKELFAPNLVAHYPGMPPQNYEEHEQFLHMLYEGFPDLQYTLEDLIAEGDKVVNRFTGRGTHKGEFQGIPPTGKSATVSGMGILRFAGGKIVEQWSLWDQLGMLQQLGVIPAPGQGGG
jgi:steroid delta-isomerase-like uncharacterized protein